jgi:hypothetical protein
MKPLVRANIEVKPSPIHGLGVFATAAIPANTLLEECHLLFFPSESTLLRSYQFRLNDAMCVLPLGCGAIYNHADQPNASYDMDAVRNVMLVKSKRPLAKGEEIFISYGETWFSSRHLKPAQASWSYRAWQWLKCSSVPRVGLLAAILITALRHVST